MDTDSEKVYEEMCTICIGKYSDEKMPFKLSGCEHIFHQDCVMEWTRECLSKNDQPTCPNCRTPFDENKFQLVSRLLKIKKTIQVFLKDLEGKSKLLEIENTIQLRDFCKIVKIRTGIEENQQRFTFNGKGFSIQSDGQKNLHELGIKEGSNIFLLLRLKGGLTRM